MTFFCPMWSNYGWINLSPLFTQMSKNLQQTVNWSNTCYFSVNLICPLLDNSRSTKTIIIPLTSIIYHHVNHQLIIIIRMKEYWSSFHKNHNKATFKFQVIMLQAVEMQIHISYTFRENNTGYKNKDTLIFTLLAYKMFLPT